MLKFSCEKALLQAAAATASRAVAAKSSIPALEGLLLEGGDSLTLSGYNTQTGIRTRLEADVREEGRIVLNARLFGDIIRRMPDDMIVFSADEKLMVHLSCGDASFEILGLSADDYPELPEVDGIMGTGSYGEIVAALEELTVESDKGPLLSEWAAFYTALSRELTYQRSVKLGRACPVPSDRDAAIVQTVTAAVNAENPLEGERLLLDLEFRRLDGMIGLHNFDDHALYGYAMKLQLLERQRTFRYESGKRAFDGLMQSIRQQVSSL